MDVMAFQKGIEVDLWDTSLYNEDTYYPCRPDTVKQGVTGLNRFNLLEIVTTLSYSGVPSWAQHSAGIWAYFSILRTPSQWGTTENYSIVLSVDFKHYGYRPFGYRELQEASLPIVYLRGGCRYLVSISGVNTITLYVNGYTYNTSTGGTIECPTETSSIITCTPITIGIGNTLWATVGSVTSNDVVTTITNYDTFFVKQYILNLTRQMTYYLTSDDFSTTVGYIKKTSDDRKFSLQIYQNSDSRFVFVNDMGSTDYANLGMTVYSKRTKI